jgi:hypothetical protein
MSFKIVQKIPTISIASAGGISTSIPIAMKTGYLRITPEDSAYIEISPNPQVDNASSLWVSGGDTVVIKQEWGSRSFIGIQTGSSTTIIFESGTAAGFAVGDVVSISGASPAGVNTSLTTVNSIETSTSYDSYYNTRMTVNWNTSGITTVTSPVGEIRKVTKVAAYNAGSGANKIHITEIQANAYA